jgi:hypothetical protein
MPTFLFTNSLMLAGMAALAIPIAIHLLLKHRKKRIQFSTIRFFKAQDEQSSRRRKLRNWLLLSLRLLIVALLVLAFSRPYSHRNTPAGAGGAQRRVVFIVDLSASMLAIDTGGQRWSLAKDRIRKAVSELGADDAVAVVEAASHANVLSGFAPPAQAGQFLNSLSPGYGSSNLAEAVREAVRLLAGRPAGSKGVIYVVSDFQKAACRSLSSSPIPQEIEVSLLPVGDLFTPNFAILRLQPNLREGSRPHVTLASFSDEDASSANLLIQIDGEQISSTSVGLAAGAVSNMDLLLPALKPGWHDIKASLRTKDGFEADNSRFSSVWVPRPSQLLVVEPRTTSRVFEQETFFLTAALDPSKGSSNSISGAFQVTQTTPEELPSELASSSGGKSWNLVILPGLKDLPLGIGQKLSAFVKAGGGLLLFLGEGMSANRYNSELADLLPTRIGNAEPNLDLSAPWRIAWYDTNCLAFSPFRAPNSGDLGIPEFTQRYSIEPAEHSAKNAFFQDGTPLVLTRMVGKGKVVLVNTSADTAWSDWPKHKTFVPFVHGLAKYCAERSDEALPESLEVVAGEDFDLNAGKKNSLAELVLRTPDRKELKLKADDQGRLRDPEVTVPGVYTLLDKQQHEILRFSLNLPEQESNLEAMRPADFEQQLARTRENSKQTLAAGLFGPQNGDRQFWQALLLAALILLLAEPFIANRTSV